MAMAAELSMEPPSRSSELHHSPSPNEDDDDYEEEEEEEEEEDDEGQAKPDEGAEEGGVQFRSLDTPQDGGSRQQEGQMQDGVTQSKEGQCDVPQDRVNHEHGSGKERGSTCVQAVLSKGEASEGNKRKSRWGPEIDGQRETQDGAESGVKKRKSRWAVDEEPKSESGQIILPHILNELYRRAGLSPEIQFLKLRLLEITRMLHSGQMLDTRPASARSPSPEPIYDNWGHRTNTREFRARTKLNRERRNIIEELVKKDPSFKPPPDYTQKLFKKLYVPVKDYPNYNFIGIIIGPQGNTLKRMEKETGAKILIRGKGSEREDRAQQAGDAKSDPSETDDLHVLIEAETRKSLEEAAQMVEKLLVPLEENNEHKRAQLRELAQLKGPLRDYNSCFICKGKGHQGHACPFSHLFSKSDVIPGVGGYSTIDYLKMGSMHGNEMDSACPSHDSSFNSGVLCRICGDGRHSTIDCPTLGPVQGINAYLSSYPSLKSDVLCRICGGGGHSTMNCPKMVNSVRGIEMDTSCLSSHPASRMDSWCRICGVVTHSSIGCPMLGSIQRSKMDNMDLSCYSTFKSDVLCRICGDHGHYSIDCPTMGSAQAYKIDTGCPSHHPTFKSNVLCQICGDGHFTIDCPMMGSVQGKVMDNDYKRSLVELGCRPNASSRLGYGDVGSSQQVGPTGSDVQPLHSSGATSIGLLSRGGVGPSSMGGEIAGGGCGFGPATEFGNSTSYQGHANSSFHSGSGQNYFRDSDESYLFVGHLPNAVDNDDLSRMFSRFGRIDDAVVIKDSLTGTSTGYGFIKFSDPVCAAHAAQLMNGFRLGSSILSVKVVGRPSSILSDTTLSEIGSLGMGQLGGGGHLSQLLQQHPSEVLPMGTNDNNLMGLPSSYVGRSSSPPFAKGLMQGIFPSASALRFPDGPSMTGFTSVGVSIAMSTSGGVPSSGIRQQVGQPTYSSFYECPGSSNHLHQQVSSVESAYERFIAEMGK